ncbi:hypothetical protein BDF20DRAFT_863319 [Mycotypha africana]|uniref:uncharacterized protein n=1 Tax=Mycotypha africana TaxID=64632 RepID=UPI002301EF82|nr:uncharacterized protein BDF20DRAFT_863319 [Mycotypha africana]KAI8981798.1 hypothetical protein BDF20DRAFT_863319 [Mycotypha africana]
MTNFMRIDLSDFDNRRDEISADLMKAASEHGLFYVVNHGICSEQIRTMFEASQTFFELPEKVKETYSMDHPRNAGWEKLSQVRPSTGVADLKESIQLSFHNSSDLRPSEEHVPGFDSIATAFMEKCNQVSQQLLTCFAIGLGFPADFFTRCHDISQPDCLNSLRCTRYFEHKNQPEQTQSSNIGACRIGAHNDINTFSLLFQQEEETGLEVFHDNHWTPIHPVNDEIVCNVGDMIVRWSDDRLQSKSKLHHRVRTPRSHSSHSHSNSNSSANSSDGEEDGSAHSQCSGGGEVPYRGPRYALEYVNEANRSVIIQGRTKYTQPITAGEFLMMATEKNYKEVMKNQEMHLATAIRNVAALNHTTASVTSITAATHQKVVRAKSSTTAVDPTVVAAANESEDSPVKTQASLVSV